MHDEVLRDAHPGKERAEHHAHGSPHRPDLRSYSNAGSAQAHRFDAAPAIENAAASSSVSAERDTSSATLDSPAAGGVSPSGWRLLPLLRRAAAVGMVGLALWWLVVPLMFPVSSEAVVNAAVVQVRAPMDGITEELRLRVGDAVHAGEPVVRLVNPHVEAVHLSKLRTQYAEVCARHARLVSELREVEAAEETCRNAAQTYRDGRITILKACVRETSAAIEAAKYQHANAESQTRRTKVLATQNAISTAEREISSENELVAQKRIEQLEANLTGKRTELEATGKGVFLQSETPYCVQRAQELALRIPLLRASLREAEELRAALTPELAREQERVGSRSEATAASPVSGIVWNCQGNLGQVVKQNESIYHIADSGEIFVEALLHQRHLASVEPGSEATILLAGGKVYSGHVRAVRTATGDSKSIYAIKLASDDMKQVSVLIDFDSPGVTPELIGRHARVIVTPADPGASQRAVAWAFSWMGR
jgi:multidrug resistance efflux pump